MLRKLARLYMAAWQLTWATVVSAFACVATLPKSIASVRFCLTSTGAALA